MLERGVSNNNESKQDLHTTFVATKADAFDVTVDNNNTNNIDKLEEEQVIDKKLIQDLLLIVFEYLPKEKKTHYDTQHTFFSNLSMVCKSQATQCAEFILAGAADQAEALAEKNPSILFHEVKLADRRGNEIKGTPFQIAAMVNDFNIRDREPEETKDYGLVERLGAHLPNEEVIKQLKAVFPENWEVKTKERMQSYVEALNTFLNNIIEIKADSYEAIETEGAPYVEKLKHALTPNPDQVIICGYLFDLQILGDAIQLLNDNLEKLGGWSSKKSKFFCIHGFGLLQTSVNVCDLQILREGLHNVTKNKKNPNRSLNFAGGTSPILTGIGVSHFLNIFGRLGTRLGDKTAHSTIKRLQELHLAKISKLRTLMDPSRRLERAAHI
jgi:hypothetical protein